MKKQSLATFLASAFLAISAMADTTVEISGNDQMKYDKTAFEVKAGEKVTVILKNAGTLPKTAMAHNFVLLQKGEDVVAFAAAGMAAADKEYIADDQAAKVLAKTKLLGPGESDTITFTAPAEAGDYPFLCTFPAHCVVGMKGAMTVK